MVESHTPRSWTRPLPKLGEAAELDEHPAVQVLRHHLDDAQAEWESWHTRFATLIEACDAPPVATMAELLNFWRDIGILTTDDADTDEPIWTLTTTPPSPWRVV